jgi:hypothetical protein
MACTARLLRPQQAAVQILLLLCCLACADCQYNNYMIGPTSYLDVVRPPAGSYVPPAIHTEAGLQQQGRTLRQAASRFDKPYNVCVSDWLPMVSCTPDDDHTTFTGETSQTFKTAVCLRRQHVLDSLQLASPAVVCAPTQLSSNTEVHLGIS